MVASDIFQLWDILQNIRNLKEVETNHPTSYNMELEEYPTKAHNSGQSFLMT